VRSRTPLLSRLPTGPPGRAHDLGKNIVDIIITNNGSRVINLGIKVPLAGMPKAANENKADAIGMSGLLVKSLVVMRENLEEMTRQGVEIPVMLGAAALTRNAVEQDCVAAYGTGRVAYASARRRKLRGNDPTPTPPFWGPRLLGGERIGVSLSDEWRLHLEQSTSAIVVHHRRARNFSV
jgi:cobalamin-dependent methionine synthase I